MQHNFWFANFVFWRS